MTPMVVEGKEPKLGGPGPRSCHGHSGLEPAMSYFWGSVFPSVNGDNEDGSIADWLPGPPCSLYLALLHSLPYETDTSCVLRQELISPTLHMRKLKPNFVSFSPRSHRLRLPKVLPVYP